MSKCIFTIGSITQAIKAKRVLAEYSLVANTIKISSGNERRGCLHGIEFGCENTINVSRVLSRHGIKFEEYRQ